MDLEQFTKLIDEHLGNKMLVEVKDNKIYTGFNKNEIEELYVKLNLPVVSQLRELLIAYEKSHYTFEEWHLAKKQCIEDIDNFLAINCG